MSSSQFTHCNKPGCLQWRSVAIAYGAQLLKALVRGERNQQVMAMLDMPRRLLQVALPVFRTQSTAPLKPALYYMLERLSSQHLHPRELRYVIALSCFDDRIDHH